LLRQINDSEVIDRNEELPSRCCAELRDEAEFCPLVWDGLQCWPETPAGHLAVKLCPHYVDNFIIDGLSSHMPHVCFFFVTVVATVLPEP